MREKNIRRAAHALYLSQGDDKNTILASNLIDKEPSKLVKDQGRALVILEKLVLPQGKYAYSEEEMYNALYSALANHGHRIQDDEAEDEEVYLQEKEDYEAQRKAVVPSLLGKTVEQVKAEKEAIKAAAKAGHTIYPVPEYPAMSLDEPVAWLKPEDAIIPDNKINVPVQPVDTDGFLVVEPMELFTKNEVVAAVITVGVVTAIGAYLLRR